MAKCIICLDHGVLAVKRDNPNDIITLHNRLASELDGRVMRVCECRKNKKSTSEKWRSDVHETKSKKNDFNGQQSMPKENDNEEKHRDTQLKL